ncbi:MAG: hypothetical protein RJA61_734 [Candidatus Parcubacteria bacterium]|jgi:very-short-patch-repair endonuclease
MPNVTPTRHTQLLIDALINKGVELKVEHWDGHKHIDIYIPKDKLYIEVDGVHHVTRPETVIADLNRDYFSFKDGFFTKHITNEAIETNLEEIVEAITHIAQNAPNKIGENLKS